MNLPFHYFKNNKYNKKTENKVIYNNYEYINFHFRNR